MTAIPDPTKNGEFGFGGVTFRLTDLGGVLVISARSSSDGGSWVEVDRVVDTEQQRASVGSILGPTYRYLVARSPDSEHAQARLGATAGDLYPSQPEGPLDS